MNMSRLHAAPYQKKIQIVQLLQPSLNELQKIRFISNRDSFETSWPMRFPIFVDVIPIKIYQKFNINQ